MAKGDRKLFNEETNKFSFSYSYSDIINSDEYKNREQKDNRKTLALKAMNGIATAIAEFDVVCGFINALEEEKEKWLKAALDHSTKELQSKYTNKATEIKTQLGMRKKHERGSKPSIDDLF